MKPMGSIPADFGSERPLRIAGKTADQWVAVAGDTPLFVYDMTIVADRIRRFRAAMPTGVDLHYAIKANPFTPLLAAMAPLVDGFDIASAGEMAMTLPHKPARTISFAGPGKRDDALAAAIAAGITINLESAGEADRALDIAERQGFTPRLAIRVNPDIELRGSGMRMGGRASPFGIDADAAAAVARTVIAAGAEWQGWHIFAGSQALDASAIIETQAATLDLADRLSDAVGAQPPLINLGGGFGIPYFPGEQPVDIEAIGAALAERLGARDRSGTRHAIELGRWLVGEAGVYLTRIIDRKESRGESYLVVDGGLHHQLAATGNLGTVVRRNYPVAIASGVTRDCQTVSVVGPLCTPLDRLADKVSLPDAHVGDLVAVFMAGAYGLTASPTAFLGHPAPREILVGTGVEP